MSLKSTSATSLVEVMVMMVVLTISIVGIYTMVDRGRELAMLTDTRLSAINIARDGLESVTTLRDTFALKGYESGQCTGTAPNNVNAFFSIDRGIILETNCPVPSIVTSPIPYILGDDKTLRKKTTTDTFDVCINEHGWYSQEFLTTGSQSLTNCRDGSPTPSDCIPCSPTTTFCEGHTVQNCKTRFKRQMTFASCDDVPETGYCLKVIAKVWWGDSPNDALELSQIITPLD